MRLSFYGAAGEVTGSCALVESGGAHFLVDCGAFQGGRRERLQNSKKFGFDPHSVQAVFLTHAHFDHCGRLPQLVKYGFRGPIFTTAATAHLVRIVLEDSLRVMEYDYQKYGVLPFFSEADLRQTIHQIRPVKYDEKISVEKAEVIFRDAGHILGSASIQFDLENKTLLFSGDLGNHDAPIIKDTEQPKKADVVVMETTYAMRRHEPPAERVSKLEKALLETSQHRGVLLIPAFAIERTQEVLWQLHEMADANKLPDMRFYLDSPMAAKVTDEFRHHPEDFDAEAVKAHNMHHDFLSFPRLTVTRTVEESKTINHAPAPKVIIAGSGMMEGGRIMHHLVRYLPLSNTIVLVVGYQPPRTTGRDLLDGKKFVRIDKSFVPVHAKVLRADSYSAHADHDKLTDWLKHITPPPTKIFLTHGEKAPAEEYAQFLREQRFAEATVPTPGKVYSI